jgi:hypothetical protein
MRTAISIVTLVFVSCALPATTQEQSGVATSAIPRCGKPPKSHKLIGWGKYGLQFSVPKRGVKVWGGKVDVDYVRFVIKSNDRNVALVLWFGGYALRQEPEHDTLETSASFTQTKLLDADGATIGLDSKGQTHDHTRWRRFAVGSEGAVYENASADDVGIFDQIVESACLIPYPRR